MIPRKIHFVWIGGPLPVWALRNVQEFRRLNPEHEIFVHDESVLLPCLEGAYAQAFDNASRADLLRYSALAKHGGWYFDVDFWPLRSLADAESAWGIDGKRLFLSRCQGNKNPAMAYANGVLACADHCRGIEVLIQAAERTAANGRNAYGPCLIEAVLRDHQGAFMVCDGAWWFPVNAEEAPFAYRRLTSGDEGNLSMRRGTNGQRPFAVHLWATVTARDLEEVVMRGPERRKPLAIVAATTREDHPLSALSEGLTACGFEVVRSSDAKSVGGQWDRPALIVCWNGRKDRGLPGLAGKFGVPILYVEHGFYDRQNFSQVDPAGILHWSAWARNLHLPPPEGAHERLSGFVAERYPIQPREGYILAIGQVNDDTQMDDSEIRGGVLLQQYIRRNLPAGAVAYFRPHPAMRYAPHPCHETLPMLETASEREAYLKTKQGTGLRRALEGAAFVVTINSNSIVEALCLGIPCLAFGPHTAITAGVVRRATLATLREDIEDMMDGWCPEQEDVDNYLAWLAARQWSNSELSTPSVVRALLAEAGCEVSP